MAATAILQNPMLPPVQDFWTLRREGMSLVEAMGHQHWTDYNIHDPGVTLLEALCYALTDLGYRTAYPIEDLLAPAPGLGYTPDRQGFFTARRILTNEPWTEIDYRKILIDLPGVRNAWLFVKDCPCDGLFLYANCKDESLQYEKTEHPIIIRGLWDVLVEFEEEDGVGDINSGWMMAAFSFAAGSGFSSGSIELRLPTWEEAALGDTAFQRFRRAQSVIAVAVQHIAGNTTDNANIPQSGLQKALRRPLFAKLKVDFLDAEGTLASVMLEDLPMHVRPARDADRGALQLGDVAAALEDASPAGLLALYLRRLQRADEVMANVRTELHRRRNLCEDWCRITAVPVEDIAVCADLDVAPDADIEAVLAEAYAQIDEYFSPTIRPHSLESLVEAGVAVEDIFNGPALEHGFLLTEEVQATGLKKTLQASDVINILMDIPGVEGVRNFSFGRYDAQGRHVESVPWTLVVKHQHQPRLYAAGSKFLVFKNGLPFLPNALELSDTLQVVKAKTAGGWNASWAKDLPVQEGDYIEPIPYEPAMNALPRTYGVGLAGMPANTGALRRAQALQLKAYLLPFEQLLADYLADLAAAHNLFAIDEAVTQTYASQLLTDAIISDLTALYAPPGGTPLDAAVLQALTEDAPTFLDRRNRFLDAMLSRFAESFAEYTLVLHGSVGGEMLEQQTLIEDKIRFLKEMPEAVARRGQAFNYQLQPKPCVDGNEAGLQSRLERLLGFRSSPVQFEIYEETDTDGKSFERRWRLRGEGGKILLSASTRYVDDTLGEANDKATAEFNEVLKRLAEPTRYRIKKTRAKTDKWAFSLLDETGEVIATRKQGFPSEAAAQAAVDVLVEFAKKKLFGDKMYIVEHLLLRPRNRPGAIAANGDPLLPICIGANCELCGEEDPYSFRMTVVMNGESGLADAGVAARRFAEETVRREAPAHLGVKVCWVSTAQLAEFEAAWCAWLAEGAKDKPDAGTLHTLLSDLLNIFTKLKSIHPPATLHDCVDGDDNNRVFLNHTII